MLEELEYLASVLLAVGLGFAIGYERKLRYKEAGIRTHTIVCAGSALIMVVSRYGFGDSVDADASRVAAPVSYTHLLHAALSRRAPDVAGDGRHLGGAAAHADRGLCDRPRSKSARL